jgi:cyclase
MLTKRIIPCLDVEKGRVVKGIKFQGLRDAGNPVEVAAVYDSQGADEIVFLDITASFEERKILLDIVEQTARNIYTPFTVGGGIRDIGDIRDLLNAGAEKVSINTQAVKYPDIVSEASQRFGSQCIVVAIDAKKIQNPPTKAGSREMREKSKIQKWEVYINGGRTPTDLDAIEWAKKVAQLGAGEILLTSMDFDGTKDGYDLELTKGVVEAVNIPVIASGGAGRLEHFYDALITGGAAAALAASLFHYQEYSIKQVKEYLKGKGVAVRL